MTPETPLPISYEEAVKAAKNLFTYLSGEATTYCSLEELDDKHLLYLVLRDWLEYKV